jgi:O-antigen ligase
MTRPQVIKWLKAIVYIGMYGGLLMPLVFVPKVIFPFVFSKLLFLQILIGLTFPAYLILIWLEPKLRPRWTPLYLAIVAYFVAVTLSVIFAVDPARAWWGNQERMNGLFTLLHFLIWLSMMTSLLRTWEQWRKVLLFEIVLSAIMASVALLQIPFPKLLLFPAGPRVGGLLDNPIYMAAYQIFNLFFIALVWLKGAAKSTKAWLVAIALLDIGAFLAAQSRGALVGLAAGVFVFAIVYALFSSSKKTKIVVLGGAAALFLSYGVLYGLRNTDFVKSSALYRLTDLNATTETRFIAWKIAWQGFLERPLTGWGFDDFHILFNLKYNPESLRYGYYETWFDRSHNTVMDALAMTGLFGFLTYFGIFGALFYSTYRAFKKKWVDAPIASVFFALPVAYFIQNLFVFDQPAGFTMSFFMYALVICATTPEFIGAKTEAKPAEPAKQTGRQMPWIAFGILQLLAVLLVWRASYLPAEASYYTIMSNNYFSAGIYPDAFHYAQVAATIPTPYLDEQAFLQSRNLMSVSDNNAFDKVKNWKEWHDLIVDVTDRYLAEHPLNTNPLFIYARFLQTFASRVPEDGPKAEKEYLAALKSSPKRQQLQYSLARFYIERGKKPEGHDLFKEAVDNAPDVGESHWYVGLSLIYDLNKKEEGSKELAAAMKAVAPYQLKEVREAVALGDAYDLLGDKDGFIALMPKLQTLPNGSIPLFLELARAAEHLGLMDQRNLLLGALVQADPTIGPRLAPLQNGSATSIQDSLNKTMYLEKAPTTTAAAPPVAASTSTASAQVATTSQSDTGPRLKK